MFLVTNLLKLTVVVKDKLLKSSVVLFVWYNQSNVVKLLIKLAKCACCKPCLLVLVVTWFSMLCADVSFDFLLTELRMTLYIGHHSVVRAINCRYMVIHPSVTSVQYTNTIVTLLVALARWLVHIDCVQYCELSNSVLGMTQNSIHTEWIYTE